MAANKDTSIEVPEALLARAYQATGKVTIAEALECLLTCFEKDNANSDASTKETHHFPKKVQNNERSDLSTKRQAAPIVRQPINAKKPTAPHDAKYHCRIFDEWISADTLREIWVGAVDKMHELDPAIIERLQTMVTARRSRRYVADRPQDVHI